MAGAIFGLSATTIVAAAAGCLIGSWLVKWVGIFLLQRLNQRDQSICDIDESQKREGWLSRLSADEARVRAEKLLADPQRFETRPSSTIPSDIFLSQLGPVAREFRQYATVIALPFADAEIGSDWLKETDDGNAVGIGWSEHLGNFRINVGEERIYGDGDQDCGTPVASSVHHLIILIADD